MVKRHFGSKFFVPAIRVGEIVDGIEGAFNRSLESLIKEVMFDED